MFVCKNIDTLDCLRIAVMLVKANQIKSLAELRQILGRFPYDEPTIEEALLLWANYEKSKK